jgi:hypothetical protein
VPDNYLFVPDNVRDRPLIFRLGWLAIRSRHWFPEVKTCNK